MRFLNASIWGRGARETATSATSRCAKCTAAPSLWSARNEQLGQPSSHPGPNMKCCTMSWLLPPKRSARVSLPPGASKTYAFSTLTQGSARRAALSASRCRVNAFSLVSSSWRAASHSARDTTRGCSILLVVITPSPLLWVVGDFLRAVLRTELLHDERGQPARRGRASDEQRHGSDAHGTHGTPPLSALHLSWSHIQLDTQWATLGLSSVAGSGRGGRNVQAMATAPRP